MPGHYFEFKWPHPAADVVVTGTFDEWKGSVKLQKDNRGLFSAVVELEENEKTFYKYIVDGNWTVNEQEHKERDPSGIENNVLYKSEVMSSPPESEQQTASLENILAQSAAPESTTTALAADVPREADKTENIFMSSAAPTSTTAELAAQVPYEKDIEVDERPTPGMADIPGGFPETPATETEGTYSVNPMPAVRTAGNPITLAPGEPVPTFTTESVDDTVHHDKESYEKADASNLGVGFDAPVLPPVVTPAEERAEKGTGVLDVPLATSLIPESSLPIVEAQVPEIVKISQEMAHAEPEASAVPEAVVTKKEIEKEIETVVTIAPVTSEGPSALDTATETAQQAKATVETAIASNVAMVSEQVAVATEKVKELSATVSETVAQKVDAITGTKEEEPLLPTVEPVKEVSAAPSVPAAVKESQAVAHACPEASASEELVHKKADFEQELVANPPHLHHVQEAKTGTEVKKAEALVHAPIVLAAPVESSSTSQSEAINENTPPLDKATTNSTTESGVKVENEPEITSEKSPAKKEKRRSALFARIKSMFK